MGFDGNVKAFCSVHAILIVNWVPDPMPVRVLEAQSSWPALGLFCFPAQLSAGDGRERSAAVESS